MLLFGRPTYLSANLGFAAIRGAILLSIELAPVVTGTSGRRRIFYLSFFLLLLFSPPTLRARRTEPNQNRGHMLGS